MKAAIQLLGSLPGAVPVPGVPGPGPGSDFHPLRDPWPIVVLWATAGLRWRSPVPFAAVPFEVIPNAVPGCRRIADGAVGLPVAKAAGVPAEKRRNSPNEAQARCGRRLAARSAGPPSSVHRRALSTPPAFVLARFVRRRCCSPVTYPPANAAAPGRRRPANRKRKRHCDGRKSASHIVHLSNSAATERRTFSLEKSQFACRLSPTAAVPVTPAGDSYTDL